MITYYLNIYIIFNYKRLNIKLDISLEIDVMYKCKQRHWKIM